MFGRQYTATGAINQACHNMKKKLFRLQIYKFAV
jgi:hypothetical protein